MNLPVLESAVEAARSGRPVALVTLVDIHASTPRELGARMLVFADRSLEGTIGGGRMEALAIDEAVAAIEAGAPRLVDLELSDVDMECGGRVKVYVEPLVAPPRLLLFGGGHVGREISLLASRLGLAVHVVDDREEWASAERFPEAARVLAMPFVEAAEALGVRPTDRIVIVTRGHAHDQEVLEHMVGRGAAYLGMIGSRRKVHGALGKLAEAGVPQEEIDRIRAPIGLDLGGDSPAEIAVSVVAEMVALSHGRGEVRPLSEQRRR